MFATPKITKRIRDLAHEFYDSNDRWGDLLTGKFGPDRSSGSYRMVIVEDGIAIKFALNNAYAAHNRAEWDLWRSFPKSVQEITTKPFCISKCGRVMAMELVSTTVAKSDDHVEADGDKFNDRLKLLLKESGMFSAYEIRGLTTDNHNNNIGVRENGDLCWIDFAAYAD